MKRILCYLKYISQGQLNRSQHAFRIVLYTVLSVAPLFLTYILANFTEINLDLFTAISWGITFLQSVLIVFMIPYFFILSIKRWRDILKNRPEAEVYVVIALSYLIGFIAPPVGFITFALCLFLPTGWDQSGLYKNYIENFLVNITCKILSLGKSPKA